MNQVDRDRMIERVRKCLELSKSSNEHEAAAAVRQAQKIMAAYNITESDVGLAEYVDSFVDHDDYEYGTRKPLTVSSVISIVSRAFGVEAVWECSPAGKHRVRYFGRKANVMIAVHTHSVVYRALGRAWRDITKAHPEIKGVRNARASFAAGWCQAVLIKIEDLRPTGEEKDKIQKKKEQRYGGRMTAAELGSKTLDRSMATVGYVKGEEFSISTPVGSERNRLEKL